MEKEARLAAKRAKNNKQTEEPEEVELDHWTIKMESLQNNDVEEWDVNMVGWWMERIRMGRHGDLLNDMNIDGEQLVFLTADRLEDNGVSKLHVKKILRERDVLIGATSESHLIKKRDLEKKKKQLQAEAVTKMEEQRVKLEELRKELEDDTMDYSLLDKIDEDEEKAHLAELKLENDRALVQAQAMKEKIKEEIKNKIKILHGKLEQQRTRAKEEAERAEKKRLEKENRSKLKEEESAATKIRHEEEMLQRRGHVEAMKNRTRTQREVKKGGKMKKNFNKYLNPMHSKTWAECAFCRTYGDCFYEAPYDHVIRYYCMKSHLIRHTGMLEDGEIMVESAVEARRENPEYSKEWARCANCGLVGDAFRDIEFNNVIRWYCTRTCEDLHIERMICFMF